MGLFSYHINFHNFFKDFRKGMNLYLTRHQYNNTFTGDLWTALEEASNKPIKEIMSTWTLQKGFPVIKVEKEIQMADGSRVLSLSQTKFIANGGVDGELLITIFRIVWASIMFKLFYL